MDQFLLPTNAFNAELHQQKLIDMLMEHDNRDDLCRENPELNHLDGTLAGQQVMYLQAKPEALLKFFKQVGCAYDTIGTTDKGEKVPHYTPKDNNDKVLLLQVLRHSCARYINNELKHRFLHQRLVGIQYYCDTPTPEAHLLYEFSTENTTTTYPTLNPINLPTAKTKNTEEDDDDDIDSPLSTSAYSQANQRRLIQLQQQAVNSGQGRDDDKQEPEPIKPTPLTPNISALQQAQHQQQQAIEDDDDEEEEKKKRDRRLQKQRTRQRQSNQQTEAEKQADEARIIREQCLKAEAKRDEELKHPKPGSFTNPWSHHSEPDDGLSR